MNGVPKDPARPVGPNLVDELSEDLDVAIGEFLERHPRTSSRRVAQALRMVERRACGAARRLATALALLAALVVGVVLGLMLG